MDRITAANVFIAIIDQGSLTGAADSLSMSRSMVTRYLNEMEIWANARLLHRSTRQLSLTPAGEKVLVQCEKLLLVADEVSATSDIVDAPLKGSLRISCSQSLGDGVLVPLLKSFLLRYPGVSIDLHVSNRAVNLIKERIDLAIRVTNDLDPNLIGRKLGECASVVCASPAYIDKAEVLTRIDDLSKHNCLTYSHFGYSNWTFHHINELVSIPVNGNLSANDPTVLLKATRAGIGLSLQPYYATISDIEKGNLVALFPEYQPETLGIYGLYSSRRHMPKALRAMIDMLVDELAQQRI